MEDDGGGRSVQRFKSTLESGIKAGLFSPSSPCACGACGLKPLGFFGVASGSSEKASGSSKSSSGSSKSASGSSESASGSSQSASGSPGISASGAWPAEIGASSPKASDGILDQILGSSSTGGASSAEIGASLEAASQTSDWISDQILEIGSSGTTSANIGASLGASNAEMGASGASSSEICPSSWRDTSQMADCKVDQILDDAVAAVPAVLEAVPAVPEAVPAVPEAAAAVPEAAVAAVDMAAIRQITIARVSALYNTGLELSICLSWGEFYVHMIREKNSLISFLDPFDLRAIVFYHRHCIREEHLQRWTARKVAHSLQLRINSLNQTVGQELECARGRIRFDRIGRCFGCPAIYAPLFAEILYATAMAWVLLEEIQAGIDLVAVLSLTKNRLLLWKRNPGEMPLRPAAYLTEMAITMYLYTM